MIKKLVYECLDQYPQSRNDDFLLWLYVIQRGEGITIEDDVPVILCKKYPHASVVRYRADIQNKEGLCQATDRVKIQRAKHAETKRKIFGLFAW